MIISPPPWGYNCKTIKQYGEVVLVHMLVDASGKTVALMNNWEDAQHVLDLMLNTDEKLKEKDYVILDLREKISALEREIQRLEKSAK